MDYKKTGRDRGDGATRKSLLQQKHADFTGNSTEAQRARLLAAMREAGHVTTTEARLFLEVMKMGVMGIFFALMLHPPSVPPSRPRS